MDSADVTRALKARAAELGFTLSGACPAVEPAGLARFHQWLEAGYAGEMQYLPARREAYSHPRHVLEGARSLLLLGMPYRTAEPESPRPGEGRVARYAWGIDYHDVIRDRLHALCDLLREKVPDAAARGVVDTAPLAEREFAQLAGLGWIGKNTLLLNKQAGSWFFLAAIITDAELEYDAPHEAQHCGTCTACLDACPTQAFVAPYVLDARRCISYLTIELRENIPLELRERLGEWVFGCDVCQDVCPWNNHAPVSDAEDFQPRAETNPLDLRALFELDDEAFRRRFKQTPLWRPKRRGLLRNAAIVLGNQRDPDSLPALVRGLNDEEPIVRSAAAWAIGRLPGPDARKALEERLVVETEPTVRAEIEAAIGVTSTT